MSGKTEATAGLVSRDYCSVVALSTTCFSIKNTCGERQGLPLSCSQPWSESRGTIAESAVFITFVGFVAETPLLSLVKKMCKESRVCICRPKLHLRTLDAAGSWLSKPLEGLLMFLARAFWYLRCSSASAVKCVTTSAAISCLEEAYSIRQLR